MISSDRQEGFFLEATVWPRHSLNWKQNDTKTSPLHIYIAWLVKPRPLRLLYNNQWHQSESVSLIRGRKKNPQHPELPVRDLFNVGPARTHTHSQKVETTDSFQLLFLYDSPSLIWYRSVSDKSTHTKKSVNHLSPGKSLILKKDDDVCPE